VSRSVDPLPQPRTGSHVAGAEPRRRRFWSGLAASWSRSAIRGVINSYYSSADRPTLPYWQLGFADTTLRLLGSDDFAPPVKADAAPALTAALLDGTLRSVIAARVPLTEVARAQSSSNAAWTAACW
jgi:hypothetical protein